MVLTATLTVFFLRLPAAAPVSPRGLPGPGRQFLQTKVSALGCLFVDSCCPLFSRISISVGVYLCQTFFIWEVGLDVWVMGEERVADAGGAGGYV